MRGIWKLLVVALVLWAGCASPGEPPSGDWPDVTYPSGFVRTKLTEIAAWAHSDNREDVKAKAQECLTHTGVHHPHCGAVYKAWAYAQRAFGETDPGKKTAAWDACLEELTHPPSGP